MFRRSTRRRLPRRTPGLHPGRRRGPVRPSPHPAGAPRPASAGAARRASPGGAAASAWASVGSSSAARRRPGRPRPGVGRPGGPGSVRRRARRWCPAAGAARGGPGCAGGRGTRWSGPRPGRQASPAHSSVVSARRRSRRGRRSRRMPASPSRPAPPQEVEQHGLGLIVGGVPGEDVGRQDGVAGRPRPGLQVRPAATSIRSALKPAPKRAGPSATTSASAVDPARSPWSTWTAVVRQPAAVASTRRASESAPPDTAHVTGVSAGGNRQRGRRSAGPRRAGRGSGHLAGRPTRSSQRCGSRISSSEGSCRGPPSRRRPPGGRPPRCGR